MSIVSRTSPPFGDRGQATAYIGETVNAGFRLQQPDGAGGWELQDYSGRVFGLRVYSDGGTTLVNVLGTLTAHADGAYIACNIPGTTTDDLAVGLYGWEFVEFVADGRIVIAGGPFKVATASAAAQASGSSGTSSAGSTIYTLRTDLGIVAVNYMGAPGYSVPTGGTVGQYVRKSSSTNYDMAWDTITSADVSGLDAQLAALQAADADLAVIAALTPSNDDLLQRKAGAWANRTPAQVKTDLALVKGDVGLGNVDNTSDANKPVSTAQQAALDLKLNLAGGLLSGVLAFVAGTAALPGLAVAGDLNTGIYGVSADVLGVTAGGSQVQSWGVGTSTLTGSLLMGADATYNIGASGANRPAAIYSVGGQITSTGIYIASTGNLGWSSTSNPNGAADLLLNRGGAATLQQGANAAAPVAQVTTIGGARDTVDTNTAGADWTISGSRGTGTGAGGNIQFSVGLPGSTGAALNARIPIFRISGSSGNLIWNTHNTYDIGGVANAAKSIYAGTGLYVGSGAASAIPNGAGANFTPAFGVQAVSGVVGLSVGIVDGSSNRRAGLFVNDTAGVWGLSHLWGGTAAPFVISMATTEVLRITSAGVATLYNNLLFGTDNSFDVGALAANRARTIYAGTSVYAPIVGFDTNNFLSTSGGFHYVRVNGADRFAFGPSNQLQLRSDGTLGWTAGTSPTTTPDLFLYRDAAGVLALRNVANAQEFRVYNTTDGTNLERAFIRWSSNTMRIGTEAAGTGTARGWSLWTNGVSRWEMGGTAGHWLPSADATYDVGSTSQRVRSGYFGTNVMVGTIPTGLPTTPNVAGFGNSWAFLGGDTVTDAASKRIRIGMTHYTNAEEPFTLIDATAGSTTSVLNIGGGTGSGNAVTEVSVWTAANNTTTTGTQRWTWNSSGHFLAGADNTYDIGASGASRVRNLYVADSVFSTYFRFPSSTRLQALSDGGLRVSNNAISNFAILEAEAANTLALRNGNNTQTLNLYRLTDGTNLERLSVYYSSGFNILTEAAGTGVVRDMRIGAGAGGGLYLRGGGTDRWVLYSTGVLNPAADATYDLGSSSLQIRDAYLSRYLKIGGAAPAGAANISAIQAFGQSFSLIGGDVLTDATNKAMRVGSLHYLAAEEPVGVAYSYSSSTANIVMFGGGSSSLNAATDLYFYTAANTTTTTGTLRWQITSAGHYLAVSDNTYDIGASGANRPRDVNAARDLVAGGNLSVSSSSRMGFSSQTRWRSPSDGNLTIYNAAETDFSRLQFGGTTSAFPALKRISAGLGVRLADDSAYATLYASEGILTSRVYAYSTTAIPAGGSAGVGFQCTSTGNFGVFFGSGAPTLSAAKGSLYLRSDGSGTGDRMYVNTDGATAWTAVTTAT